MECTSRSVPGKRPWALKHNSGFWPAWAPTRDINSICLYRSCNSDPLKFGAWALTQEWVLARDTRVLPVIAECLNARQLIPCRISFCVCMYVCMLITLRKP